MGSELTTGHLYILRMSIKCIGDENASSEPNVPLTIFRYAGLFGVRGCTLVGFVEVKISGSTRYRDTGLSYLIGTLKCTATDTAFYQPVSCLKCFEKAHEIVIT